MNRQSIRLRDRDYTECGMYFVTLCTANRKKIFGKVRNGAMQLETAGAIVEAEWQRIGELRDSVWVDEFVVMPDHFHGILIFAKEQSSAARANVATLSRKAGSLGAIVGGFKSIATSLIRSAHGDPNYEVWQRN